MIGRIKRILVYVKFKCSRSKVGPYFSFLNKPKHCFIQTKVIVVTQMFHLEGLYRLMVVFLAELAGWGFVKAFLPPSIWAVAGSGGCSLDHPDSLPPWHPPLDPG